jgi:hypothetical protein
MSNQSARMESSVGSWRWYERLVLFCYGFGIGGWLFCFVLAGELTPSSRPALPEPEFGFTYLVQVAHSRSTVYVTYFEYLALTYGPLATWGFGVISGLCGYLLGIRNKKSLGVSAYIQIACACATSLMLIYLAWYFSAEQALLGLSPVPHH